MADAVTIFASSSPGEVRVAAVRDGVLLDYAIDRPACTRVGDVFRGRVRLRASAMAGAFVSLGQAPDGFLPDTAGGAGTSEGTVLSVRVSRAPQGGKGPRLAAETDTTLPPGPIGRVARGVCAVERLAALHAQAPVIVDDSALLAQLRPGLGARLRLVAKAFDDALEAEADSLAQTQVELPGGGVLRVEATAALMAMDVDLGARAAWRGAKGVTHGDANVAWIPEIARQIRLRSLGGPIVVDFAGLSARARKKVGPALADALGDDPAGARFLGFSALGLAEILRPRTHPPLHELLRGPHAAALAVLRAAAREMAAVPSRAPIVSAGAEVAEALAADREALADFVRCCGRALTVRTDRALPPLSWRLEQT